MPANALLASDACPACLLTRCVLPTIVLQAKKGDMTCTCIGGFLMSWTDEYWKGAKAQAACDPPYPHRNFKLSKCQAKAHITCGNWKVAGSDRTRAISCHLARL